MQNTGVPVLPAIISAVCLAGACVVLPVGAEVYAQSAQQAEVTSISGTVEVMLSDADGYAAAEEGMLLEAGDTIRTGGASSVELSFNQDNTNLVRLSEYTTVRLTLSVDEKLEMTDGEVFATINGLSAGSSFEIRTPTAVSGARGTDWVTKVTSEGTDVEAVDSQPYVRHFEPGGEVSRQITPIQPGQMTTVRKFQQPGAMRPVSGARQQQWQTMKQDVRRRGSEAVAKRQQRPAFDRQDFKQRMKQPQSGDRPPIAGSQAQSRFKPLEFSGQESAEGFKPLRSGDQPARAQQAEYGRPQIKDAGGQGAGQTGKDGKSPVKDDQSAGRKIQPSKDAQAVRDAQPARNQPQGKGVRSGGGRKR